MIGVAMTVAWRALYAGGETYDGPSYERIDRARLVAFGVTFGDPAVRLVPMIVDVAPGRVLIYRRRRSRSGLDIVIVATENPDRSQPYIRVGSWGTSGPEIDTLGTWSAVIGGPPTRKAFER